MLEMIPRVPEMTGRLVRGPVGDPVEDGLSVLWLDICLFGPGRGVNSQ